MIHDTCPCCEVTRAPHEDDCTFADDCPDACATFDYVAELRAELDAALAEVERHRMTEEEREAVRKVSRVVPCGMTRDPDGTIRITYKPDPAGDALRGYLHRTREGE